MNPRYDARVFAISKASFAALLLATALASGPARACTPKPKETRVRVSFLADSDLATMVKWAREQTCADYAFDATGEVHAAILRAGKPIAIDIKIE
jgi:hypothetical protein